MKVDIKVPAVGESITEATIAEWTKKEGDIVQRDEVLIILETDKASVEVVAEQAGQLSIKVEEGETVEIGAVVGNIDTDKAGEASSSEGNKEEKSETSASGSKPSAKEEKSPNADHLSPAVRRVVDENKLDPKQIEGTGKGGRLTKEDAMKASEQKPKSSASSSSSSTPLPTPKVKGEMTERREKMTTIRKRIAQRLVEAQHNAAILTTFNEIDMSAVMDLRQRYKDSFKEKYGISLGFMGFFVKATVEALKAFPKVNAFIDGDEVVYHDYQNVGIAVGTEKGLIVPVIKQAEQLSIAEIEMSIRHFAGKAREGKITVDDLSGGTFTISNGGVYGSLMSTPILNPPQSGILGMHKIEERPIAKDGQVVIRPMMYVALSYDHRIIDGSESVSFLVKIKEGIEDPARMLIEI